jgi:hypothetical protein
MESSWLVLSASDYLREKTAESRHDETSAYLMFVAGCVLFVGGVLETLLLSEVVDWILFVPVAYSGTTGAIFGLTLTLSGLAMMVFGLIAGFHFSRNRSGYMKGLRGTTPVEKGVDSEKKRKTSP